MSHPVDPHHGTYRVILGIIAVAIPLAGVLAWSQPLVYDVFAVRFAFSVAALGILTATWSSGPVQRVFRELTLALASLLAAWFLWVGHNHSMHVDDVVGLMPILLFVALLIRRPVELAVCVLGLGLALVLVYTGLPDPAFPLGIVALVFGVIVLSVGWMSVSRERLERQLLEANEALESRVSERTAALRASEAEARRASQAKSVFLANMSHELRTPLTAILGYVEIACEDLDGREPTVREDLGKAGQAAHHLLTLIDDLLDLARIEAGRMDLAVDAVSVPHAVSAALRMVAAEMESNRNEVVTSVPADLRVRGDADRLRQILVNLLSNAAKFTQAGRVDVFGEIREREVRIEVADTGIGMAPEVLASAFDRFTQGDASSTRRHGGSGLGLAISHELAVRMGGRIEVRSEPGAGSTFTVVLPRA